MGRSHSNRLLVEGAKDRRLIPYLMEKNGVSWQKGDEPVSIQDLGQNALTKVDASAFLKEPGLHALGIILDADQSVDTVWQRMRSWFSQEFSDMPATIPSTGFISAVNPYGIRLGAWIMPDNLSSGMLETFLKYLVRSEHQPLWDYAKVARDEAKSKHGAPFKSVHLDKAWMHTFLAWQDEPGPQLHEAVDHTILDPTCPYSQPFVAWFRQLFGI